MRKFLKILLPTLFLGCITTHPTLALQNMFYCDRGDISKTLAEHHNQIGTLIAQAYHTGPNGELKGYINPKTVSLAKQYHITVIAQLTNRLFDMNVVHRFLTNSTQQTQLIQGILKESQKYNLDGIQVDFEHIHFQDAALFNNFIKQLSQALHQDHRKLYVAIIPPLNMLQNNHYFKAKHDFWTGAYDLKTLNQYADYIDLMTYDQHGDFSTPGPVAGYTWVKFVLDYSLKYVPKDKLLMGIPTYSSYWKIGNFSYGNGKILSVNKGDQISYNTLMKLLAQYHPKIRWDDVDKIHFAMFAPEFMYRFLFIEDADAIDALKKLAKHYGLPGVAFFRLGVEDPAIWKKI